MTKKKPAGGKGKGGEARAARPGKATPEERKAAREEARARKRAELDLLAKQAREAHRDFIKKVEPPPEENIDWSLRPSKYTTDLGLAFCARVAVSSKSLGKLCLEEGMPSYTTVMRWRMEEPEFDAMYARAKDDQTDHLAEECLDISNTPEIGEKITSSLKEGIKVTREDMLGHRNLKIETRQWLVSKLRPRKYGNKVAIAGDPDNPLLIGDADSMSDEALAKIAAARAAKAAAGGEESG